MTGTPDPRSHENLCAYLLGELEGEERQRLEAELASSEELAAERDRLAATIHLVQGTLGAPEAAESLPDDVKGLLHRAAESRRPAPWYALSSPTMRVAASLAVLVGGYGLVRLATTPSTSHLGEEPSTESTARLGGREDAARVGAEQRSSFLADESALDDLEKNAAVVDASRDARDEGDWEEPAESLEELAGRRGRADAEPADRSIEAGEASNRELLGQLQASPEGVRSGPARDEHAGAAVADAERGRGDAPEPRVPAELSSLGYTGEEPAAASGGRFGVDLAEADPAPDTTSASTQTRALDLPRGVEATEPLTDPALGGESPRDQIPAEEPAPTPDARTATPSAPATGGPTSPAGPGSPGGPSSPGSPGGPGAGGARLDSPGLGRLDVVGVPGGEAGVREESFEDQQLRRATVDGLAADRATEDTRLLQLEREIDAIANGTTMITTTGGVGNSARQGDDFFLGSGEGADFDSDSPFDSDRFNDALGIGGGGGGAWSAGRPSAGLFYDSALAPLFGDPTVRESISALHANGFGVDEISQMFVVTEQPERTAFALDLAALGPKIQRSGALGKFDAAELVAGLKENVAPGTWEEGANKVALVGDRIEIAAAEPVVDEVRGYLASNVAVLDEERLAPSVEVVLDPDLVVDRFYERCTRRPQESPSAMFFRYWGDNAFENALLDNQSTFGVDVDTASYALARNYVRSGYLPSKEQVRTEEFVNFFDADVPPPAEQAFAVTMELAPSRYGEPAREPWMLRVAVRGKDVEGTERDPLALTFVIDVSGSMSQGNRIELVKHGMRLLVGELDTRDTVSIVTFNQSSQLVLPPTSADNRALIEGAIYGLEPGGSTNAAAGLVLGYAQAEQMIAERVTNRVVMFSDGVANTGETDQAKITEQVRGSREKGIYLNTFGVGMGNHNDVLLEQLADKGDGICTYIDTPDEAHASLVDQFLSNFQPIARDAKIQVEFDPAQVAEYRLLGYENRAIADADFRNDAIDAGEVGAGHQVVALYEVVRHATGADLEAPLATARLRWLGPYGSSEENEARELEATLGAREASGSWEGTTAGFRRDALVAQYAEFLRRSRHAKGDSFEQLVADAKVLAPELRDPDFDEFVGLLEASRGLIASTLSPHDELTLALDAVRENLVLRAQVEDLIAQRNVELGESLRRIEQQNHQLEAELRDLLRDHFQTPAPPRVDPGR